MATASARLAAPSLVQIDCVEIKTSDDRLLMREAVFVSLSPINQNRSLLKINASLCF